MTQEELAYKTGLPANLDAERLVLGSILLNDRIFVQIASVLSINDFSLEKHRRIFARMTELKERQEPIDRITVTNELMKQGQLESVDGLGYLCSLDEGLPEIANIEAYVQIVKDKAALRKTIFAAQAIIERCLRAEDEPSEILSIAEQKLQDIRKVSDRSTSRFLSPEEIIIAAGGMDSFLSPPVGQCIPTPFATLNEMLPGGGFERGQLVIIGGNTGTGKTVLGVNLGIGSVVSGYPTHFVPLEMKQTAALRRALAAQARVNMKKLRYREASPEDRTSIVEAVAVLQGEAEPMFKTWSGMAASVMALRAELEREASKQKLGMVVVDYLQLMDTVRGGRGEENRTQEISKLTRGLKTTAMDLDCVMVVLSQLTRDNARQKRKPELSDLRDGGSIEQDADIVMFPWAGDIPEPRPMVLECDLILAKQREGPLGSIPLNFTYRYTRFDERPA